MICFSCWYNLLNFHHLSSCVRVVQLIEEQLFDSHRLRFFFAFFRCFFFKTKKKRNNIIHFLRLVQENACYIFINKQYNVSNRHRRKNGKHHTSVHWVFVHIIRNHRIDCIFGFPLTFFDTFFVLLRFLWNILVSFILFCCCYF